jgi:thermitase
MKPHLIVKLKIGVPAQNPLSWDEMITEKGGAIASLHPNVDGVFSRHRLPIWVAREYRSTQEDCSWSPEEITSGLNRIYRVILREDTFIPPALIDEIASLPVVEYVHVGQIASPDLPAAQLSIQTDKWSREAVGVPEAHYWTEGHSDVTVAVLDTGIALTHPELTDVLLPGRDFVDILDGGDQFFGDYLDADADPSDLVGHGTHVAGIIGATGRAMPRGIAPRCRILPVRVLGAMRQGSRRVGAGLVDNINVALKWAVDKGADVINMSFGIPHTGGGLPHREVVEYALQRGVTLVAAVGNDGQEKLYYPGALPGVIAVGATDAEDRVAAFSTYGSQVTVSAPGMDIFSSYLDNGYAFASGTSQAAPFVTGAVALLHSFARERVGRRLNSQDIRRILVRTADRSDSRYRNLHAGYGRLNISDAMRFLDHELDYDRRYR